MTHIMVDLETLSTLPNARIVAIGAVKFSSDKGIYDNFYQPVVASLFETSIESFIDDLGFHTSKDTLGWWRNQSEAARAVFNDPNAVTIDTALKAFSNWALYNSLIEDVYLWGNGASFDNVVLSSAYRLRNMEQPWKFWNDRCYRTIKNIHPHIKCIRKGTHHNALDDAETQAEHLLKMGEVQHMLYDTPLTQDMAGQ